MDALDHLRELARCDLGTRDKPWQEVARGCGLMLHTPLDLAADLPAMRAEFATLEADTGPEYRGFRNEDGSWSDLQLIRRGRLGGVGAPAPTLDRIPSVRALLERTGWTVLGSSVIRLHPHGVLPWHFEAQSPYMPESRLLMPLHAPTGAFTLLGDDAVAYPAGTFWTGDFNFPHQVENPTDEERLVLLVDVVNTPEVLRLMPEAMTADVAERCALSMKATQHMLHWRQSRANIAGLPPQVRSNLQPA